MPATLWVALVPLVVVLVADVWVYTDARARRGTGHEPGVRIGALRIDSPEAWAIGCLVLFVVAFPTYLVARREAA